MQAIAQFKKVSNNITYNLQVHFIYEYESKGA